MPADNLFPSPDPTSYDYDYDGDLYGFEKEGPDVYKWNVEEFPHPMITPRFCNRFKPSHVCDPDLVLEKEQADLLDSSIQKLYRETPCICDACSDGDGGIVVGIALLKHMYHPYNVHPAKVIRSFAETLRFRWKLGRCDNDILIMVATTDRLSYTDVGEATSDYLSIHEAHRIFLENKSKFSASNFSEGLMDILDGYYRLTRSMMEKTKGRKKDDLNLPLIAGAIVGSVLLVGILLFVAFVVYRRCKTNKDEVDKETDHDRGSTASSSWSKKDIKVLFGPEKSRAPPLSNAKYQKCGTEDDEKGAAEDEENMDLTLAIPDDASFPNETQMTGVSVDSEALEQDLTTAAEGIVRTFPSNNNPNVVMMTDM